MTKKSTRRRSRSSAPATSPRPRARPTAAPRVSIRPRTRQDMLDAGAVARGNRTTRRLAREAESLGNMKDGGKLKMVKGPGGKMVPDYAADGVGKMAKGGKTKAKKMKDGGMCRGMGAATRGGSYKMG